MTERHRAKKPGKPAGDPSGKNSGNPPGGQITILPERLIAIPVIKLTPFPGTDTAMASPHEALADELKKKLFFVALPFVQGDSLLDLSGAMGALGVVNGAGIANVGGSWKIPVSFVSRVRISDARKIKLGGANVLDCKWTIARSEEISREKWEDAEFQEAVLAFRDAISEFYVMIHYAVSQKLNHVDQFVLDKNEQEAEKIFLRKFLGDFESAVQQSRYANGGNIGTIVDQIAACLGVFFSRVLVRDLTDASFWAKSRDVFNSLNILERVDHFLDLVELAIGLMQAATEAPSGKSLPAPAAADDNSFPDYVKEQIQKESRRVKSPTAEGDVARNYIDWLQSLPWTKKTEDEKDLSKIEKTLEEDHYGLEEVKERILEFIAVRRARSDAKGPILCFVGPPGVGKTSLGKSIAKATGRKFVRRSLGGIHDEAELRGHRRTYIGALPGMIIQELRNAQSRNPVFMLDEVDKIGRDFRGDPAAALLEILDPEQNNSFKDHYIDLPFDLSEVFFITTANTTLTIPEPLLDRMEVIELPAYTEEEKMEIVVRHIIPKALRECGIDAENLRQKNIPVFSVDFERDALSDIVGEYTHDAGMRDPEKTIKNVLAKILKMVETGKLADLTADTAVRITKEKLRQLLGEPKTHEWHPDLGNLPSGVGVVLMVNHNGQGLIGFVEVSMRNANKFDRKCTGHLQDVMRESVDVTISRLLHETGALQGESHKKFLHIHFTDGAIPKDGPSAGLMVSAAIYSAFKKIPIKPYFAVTGEIDLKRFVAAPVGGITAKLLAAKRAGIREVAIPLANKKNIKKLPEGVRVIVPSDLGGKSWRDISLESKPEGSFTVYCVEKPEDVLELAFPNDYPPRNGTQTDAAEPEK